MSYPEATQHKVIPIVGVVQNIDRKISQRDYRDFGNDLLVTSYFVTIQGEGPLVGHPAVFLRLAGCNFGDKTDHCDWCDTSFQFDQGKRFTPETMLKTLIELPGYHPTQALVITGGEPTLQHNLIKLIKLAVNYFSDIQIETNGTQPKFFTACIEAEVMPLIKVVVSPKASKTKKGYPALNETVSWWANCLKFVISSDANSPHHVVPKWAIDTGKPVYVSPMTVYLTSYTGEVSSAWEDGLIDKVATAKNYAYAADYAIRNHLLVSMQTHTFLGIA